MLYDLTFLILSTCLHLNDSDFRISRQCQQQLTACYYKTRATNQYASVDAIIAHCLMSRQVNYTTLDKKVKP